MRQNTDVREPKPWRKDAMTLGLAAGGSTFLAIGLELTNASAFGATRSMDVYVLAMVWPSLVSMTIPGALIAVLVPRYARLKTAEGAANARLYARRWIIGYLAVGGGVALSMAWPANPVGLVFSSQLDAASRCEYARLAAPLAIAAAVFGAYSLSAAFQNADGDVRPTAAFGPIQNAVLILAVIAVGASWGPPALAAGQQLVALIALTVVVAHLGRLSAARGGSVAPNVPPATFRNSWEDGRAILLVMLSQLVYFLLTPVERFLASSLAPGSLAAMAYAVRVGGVASNLIGGVVNTLLLPRFASLSATRSHARLGQGIEEAVIMLGTLICPMVAVLGVVRQELIRVVLERRHFTAAASEATAAAILGYSVFFVVIVLARPVMAALMALGEYSAILMMNVASLAIYAPLSWAAVRLTGELTLLTAAWSACHLASIAMGLFVLRRRIHLRLGVLARGFVRIGVVTAIVAGSALAIRAGMPRKGGALEAVVIIGAGGLVGIAGIAALLLRHRSEAARRGAEEGANAHGS